MSIIFKKKQLLYLTLLAMVLISNILINQHPFFQPLPKEVVLGSVFDFLVTIPLLIYFIFLHKKHSLKYIFPVILASYFLATFIISSERLQQFSFTKWFIFGTEGIFILVEIHIIFRVIKKLPQLMATWREIRPREPYFMKAFQVTCQQVLGEKNKLMNLLSFDLSILYYSLLSWKKKRVEDDSRYFTYHVKSSYIAFIIMMIHAMVIESIGFHFLLHQWNEWIAFGLLILNIYGVFYFLGDMQAVRLCPIRVDETKIIIQIGITKRMEIDYSLIQEIHPYKSQKRTKKEKKQIFQAILTEFFPEDPQLEIILKEKTPAYYAFGIRKSYSIIHIRLDDPQRFQQMVSEKISNLR